MGYMVEGATGHMEENTERMILDIVNSEDTHVKYCNSMIETQDVEDDF